MRISWRNIVDLAIVIPLSLTLGNCGGGGGSAAPPNATPGTATDTSGDFAITARADSGNQISVWWDNPAARYAQSPESIHSTLYGSTGPIVPSTSAFRYTSTGLTPETTYCYRAEVTAVYQYFFPYSYTTVGWSSGTVCVTTPYGLRVLSTFPESGNVTLQAGAVISATFSGPIDRDSITSDSFVVSGPSGVLAGSLAVDGPTLTFTPDNALSYNIPYTATVATSVRDTGGYALASPCQWTFTKRLTTEFLRGVWGSSGSDVFAVGNNGTILHYDGSRWAAMDSGTTTWFQDVWGSSGSDVFAVGGAGHILHYDGSRWTTMDSGTSNLLLGVWGSADNNVFAVGYYGTILHYDGARWTAMDSGTGNNLTGVWGSADSDVFAVGNNGTILHYDGSRWTAMDSRSTTHFRDVWGGSRTDVFAGGGHTSPTLVHYDGSAWSGTAASGDVFGIWAASGSDVFATGVGYIMHFDGVRWRAFFPEGSYAGIWGSSGNDVFAVGDAIAHYDGSTWKLMP